MIFFSMDMPYCVQLNDANSEHKELKRKYIPKHRGSRKKQQTSKRKDPASLPLWSNSTNFYKVNMKIVLKPWRLHRIKNLRKRSHDIIPRFLKLSYPRDSKISMKNTTEPLSLQTKLVLTIVNFSSQVTTLIPGSLRIGFISCSTSTLIWQPTIAMVN